MTPEPQNTLAEISHLEGGDFTLDLDEGALAELLTPGHVPARLELADLAPSEELREVTRRIAAQYHDILLVSASSLFSGQEGRTGASKLLSALDSLERLSRAAGDTVQLGLVADIRPAVVAFAADPKGRQRDLFLARLRPWLVRYGGHVGGEEGGRFCSLVSYNVEAVPLFGQLAAIPGIGPRRLERLFCAGLYSVDVVSRSDPSEVAAVTGLPRRLAMDVVERARVYNETHKRRTVLEMRSRLAEFQRVFGALDPDLNSELWALAQVAVSEMHGVVAKLAGDGGR